MGLGLCLGINVYGNVASVTEVARKRRSGDWEGDMLVYACGK